MTHDAITAEFLSLVPAERAGRTQRALRLIFDGLAAGSILNVDFKAAKSILDHDAEAFFRKATEDFWRGKGHRLVDDPNVNEVLNTVVQNVRIYYVRDALSASKKLTKVKVAHPMIDAMRAVVVKLLPLALAMEEVRGKIVKGRRPNPEAEARKAAKLNNPNAMKRATCACCFNEQAVLPNGLVHDHGYQVPRPWLKTTSCYGRQFRPLEVSDDGLKFMVDLLTTSEEHTEEHLETTKKATRITRKSRNQEQVYTPASPDWEGVHAAAVREIEWNLENIRKDLLVFKEARAAWAPKA